MQRIRQWLLAVDGSLHEKTLRGGAWLAVGDAVGRVAAAARAIVLARLVSSQDFGLFGVSLLVVMWAERFSQWGFGAAMIQRTGNVEPYFDTAWTVQLLRGVAFAGLIALGAPLLADLLGSREAIPVIRAIGVLFLLRGLTNPAVVRLSRELDFRRFVTWNLYDVVVSLPVGIALGIVWGNVWALVGALVAGEGARAVGSFRITSYRPRLRLDLARARELTRFGRWVFGFEMVRMVVLTADSVVVSRLLGAQALGLYQMAERIAFLATTEIRGTVARLMLPAFSRLADRGSLRRAFVRVLHVVAGVTIPIGALLTVFAEPIVELLLGADWRASAAIIRVMVWCGVARAISGVTVPFFQAVGRPDLPFRTALAGGIVMMAALYPCARAAGTMGAAAAVAAGSAAALAWELGLAVQLIGPSWGELFRVFGQAIVGALPFAAAAVPWVTVHSPHWLLTLGVALALGATTVGLSLEPQIRSARARIGEGG